MLDVTIKDPESTAQGCIIWMHGLGADASDMEGLAGQFPITLLPFRHVFLNAPVRKITINAGMLMRAWFDIIGFRIADRVDVEGMLESQATIDKAIQAQIEAGFEPHQIILAGFSQGGTMALHTALHSNLNLGGVVALSGYLPVTTEFSPRLPKTTPIFMGFGQFDTLVLPEWTKMCKDVLIKNGYSEITSQQYPIEHSICLEEIQDVVNWVKNSIKGVQAE